MPGFFNPVTMPLSQPKPSTKQTIILIRESEEANVIKSAETQHKADDNSHKGPLKDIGT